MILKCVTLLSLLSAGEGVAPTEPIPDTTIERYRTPFDALTERPVGEASRAVRFDWRQTQIGFGLIGSSLVELNNFTSGRIGAYLRRPIGSFMIELAATYAFTAGSDATEKLALTPYRQYSRPGRLEIDLNASFPLAEGVVTARPGFFPPAELVFSATLGLRYLYYPGSLTDVPAGTVLSTIFSPRLSDTEINNLESRRLPAMQIDRGRYQMLGGFTLDLYLRPGICITPRVLLAIPFFSGIQGAGLGWWWELSLAGGVAL